MRKRVLKKKLRDLEAQVDAAERILLLQVDCRDLPDLRPWREGSMEHHDQMVEQCRRQWQAMADARRTLSGNPR